MHNFAVTALLYSSRYVRKIFGLRPHPGGQLYSELELAKAPDFDAKFVDFSLEGKTVLEIGCGYGGYIAHARRQKKALFVYAYEPDALRVETTNEYLAQAGVDGFKIYCGDARRMTEISDGQIDVVFSDAVLEHIAGTELLLNEIFRVLRPGGVAYHSWSPPWFHWNGGHLRKYIPIPWAHALFSDAVILDVLARQKESGEIAGYKIDEMMGCYSTLAKLSLRKFRLSVQNSRFGKGDIIHSHSNPVKGLIARLSQVTEEMFAGDVRVILRKAAD